MSSAGDDQAGGGRGVRVLVVEDEEAVADLQGPARSPDQADLAP